MAFELTALFFAVISPALWAIMNVLDKFVVSHKIKNPLSFGFIAGTINLLIGTVIALFVSWREVTPKDIAFSAISGILLGINFYFWYILIKEEDASNLVGLIYFYPVIIAILSYFFLNEQLHLLSYFGMCLTLFGAVMLSINATKIKIKAGAWMIASLILITAFYEFFIKVATINLPAVNGVAVSSVFLGIACIPMLISSKTRKGLKETAKYAGWAVLNESFTFLGVFTTYFAMAKLPATIVSSIAATQPLAVLIIEKIFSRGGIKVERAPELLPKLIPIASIVLGIMLLYLPEL
jgi:drug/metabolite transporter (DMT)-like permease